MEIGQLGFDSARILLFMLRIRSIDIANQLIKKANDYLMSNFSLVNEYQVYMNQIAM